MFGVTVGRLLMRTLRPVAHSLSLIAIASPAHDSSAYGSGAHDSGARRPRGSPRRRLVENACLAPLPSPLKQRNSRLTAQMWS